MLLSDFLRGLKNSLYMQTKDAGNKCDACSAKLDDKSGHGFVRYGGKSLHVCGKCAKELREDKGAKDGEENYLNHGGPNKLERSCKKEDIMNVGVGKRQCLNCGAVFPKSKDADVKAIEREIDAIEAKYPGGPDTVPAELKTRYDKLVDERWRLLGGNPYMKALTKAVVGRRYKGDAKVGIGSRVQIKGDRSRWTEEARAVDYKDGKYLIKEGDDQEWIPEHLVSKWQ